MGNRGSQLLIKKNSKEEKILKFDLLVVPSQPSPNSPHSYIQFLNNLHIQNHHESCNHTFDRTLCNASVGADLCWRVQV